MRNRSIPLFQSLNLDLACQIYISNFCEQAMTSPQLPQVLNGNAGTSDSPSLSQITSTSVQHNISGCECLPPPTRFRKDSNTSHLDERDLKQIRLYMHELRRDIAQQEHAFNRSSCPVSEFSVCLTGLGEKINSTQTVERRR